MKLRMLMVQVMQVVMLQMMQMMMMQLSKLSNLLRWDGVVTRQSATNCRLHPTLKHAEAANILCFVFCVCAMDVKH